MKSGNLNFLEPSGSVQACNGTALPLPLNCGFSQATRGDPLNKVFLLIFCDLSRNNVITGTELLLPKLKCSLLPITMLLFLSLENISVTT